SLAGIEPCAHCRVNTVGADQNVACCTRGPRSVEGRREMRDDRPLVRLLEGHQPMAEMDMPRAETLLDDPEHGQLKLAAVNRYLRPPISCGAAARLLPDLLSLPIEVDEFLGRNSDLEQRFHCAELIKHAHTVRQQIDPDAQRLESGCLLEHLRV